MRARVSGSAITAHGDSLAAPYVEFYGNEPTGFPTGWTVSGSSPNRVLIDPSGHQYSPELPTQTAPSGASGVTVDNGVDAPAAVTTLVAAGAVIAGSSATLLTTQLLGPFVIAFDTPGLLDDTLSGPGVDTLDLPAGCVADIFITVTAPWDVASGDEFIVRVTSNGADPTSLLNLNIYSTQGYDADNRVRPAMLPFAAGGFGVSQASHRVLVIADTTVNVLLGNYGGPLTLGEANVYAIIATPAA